MKVNDVMTMAVEQDFLKMIQISVLFFHTKL